MDRNDEDVRRLMDRYPEHFARIGNATPSETETLNADDGKTGAWLPSNRDARFLDIGCGWGNRLMALHAMGWSNLMGIDISEAMIDRARSWVTRPIRLLQTDALSFLENTDEKFDRILLFDLIEHLTVKDAIDVLVAAKECLAPSGMVVMQVPNLACVTAVHMFFSDATHKQGYTEFSLAQVLDAAGMTPTLVCPVPRANLSRWRPWRPLSGTTLGWRLNRLLHRGLYHITNVGPKARCFCPTLLMVGRR